MYIKSAPPPFFFKEAPVKQFLEPVWMSVTISLTQNSVISQELFYHLWALTLDLRDHETGNIFWTAQHLLTQSSWEHF